VGLRLELERAVPATWDRHVATVRSFSAFCVRRGWVGGRLARLWRAGANLPDRTRAIPHAGLEGLWRRDDVVVREKALWRLA
jgi:hypothetical protein